METQLKPGLETGSDAKKANQHLSGSVRSSKNYTWMEEESQGCGYSGHLYLHNTAEFNPRTLQICLDVMHEA